MIARHAPRIFVSAGEPSGDLHGAGVVAGAARAASRRHHRGARRAPHGRGRGDRSAIPMEGLAAFGLVEVVTKLGAHVRLLRALQARLPRAAATTSSSSSTIPAFTSASPRRRGRRGPRSSTTLRPSSGPGGRDAPAGSRPRSTGSPWCSRSSSASSASSASAATTSDIRWWIAACWPTRAEARARSSASRPTAVCSASFRAAGPRRSGGCGCRFATRRSGCSTRADATGSLVAGTDGGEYPDPGPLQIIRGDPIPVFAAADAALAKSGTTTLEAALADVPMVVAYKVHPLTWRMFQRVGPCDG